MAVARLKFVHRYVDRHGRARYYLRRAGRKAIPLPGTPDDPAFLAAYTAALAADDPPPETRRAPGSIAALIASYRHSAAFRQLSPRTQYVYGRVLDRVERDHGPKSVRTLEANHVRAIIAKRAATPAAANHVLRTMRALLSHAVEQGIRPDNPAREVKRLRERKAPMRTWTEPEIAAYEARWPIGTRQRLALALILYTGQRRSDVVRLGPQHVVGRSLVFRQQKTGAQIEIPIHADLQRIIAATPGGVTFLITEGGAAYTSAGFSQQFKEWGQMAGLREFVPHGGRKASLRRLAEAGASAHEIMSVSGHRTLAEAQRYTLEADRRRLAVKAVGRMPKLANRLRQTG